MKATYGVYGLIDWSAALTFGKASLIVHFTGGAMTKYGITPAVYSTSDAVMQKLIEGSEYYRMGRIVRLDPPDKAKKR